MASELRYIFFSWPEVVRAVAEYRRKAGRPLPAGKIAKRVLRQQPVIEVDIIVAAEDSDEKAVTFDANELSAALIMFCIETNVPLPITHTRKSVRVIGRRLALTVSIGAPLEELEPTIMRAVHAM